MVITHLEQRVRQTGHWSGEKPLSFILFRDLLFETIDRLDVNQARKMLPRLSKIKSSLHSGRTTFSVTWQVAFNVTNNFVGGFCG